MFRNLILWIAALLITLSSAIYQRMTGPSYPITGTAILSGMSVEYQLERSHAGEADHKVGIKIPDQSIQAALSYKRFKTEDPWTDITMKPEGDSLVGYLPHQPPAGKLQYRVRLWKGGEAVTLPEAGGMVIRFKGTVPAWVLIPHIVLMFAAMLVSTRAGLGALVNGGNLRGYALGTIVLLFIGGLLFGPIVQRYAFGQFWTGIPLGTDLTDNKTLIAFVGWLAATVAVFKGRSPRGFVLAASILMLAVFLIPHSVLGSELEYSELQRVKAGFCVIWKGCSPARIWRQI